MEVPDDIATAVQESEALVPTEGLRPVATGDFDSRVLQPFTLPTELPGITTPNPDDINAAIQESIQFGSTQPVPSAGPPARGGLAPDMAFLPTAPAPLGTQEAAMQAARVNDPLDRAANLSGTDMGSLTQRGAIHTPTDPFGVPVPGASTLQSASGPLTSAFARPQIDKEEILLGQSPTEIDAIVSSILGLDEPPPGIPIGNGYTLTLGSIADQRSDAINIKNRVVANVTQEFATLRSAVERANATRAPRPLSERMITAKAIDLAGGQEPTADDFIKAAQIFKQQESTPLAGSEAEKEQRLKNEEAEFTLNEKRLASPSDREKLKLDVERARVQLESERASLPATKVEQNLRVQAFNDMDKDEFKDYFLTSQAFQEQRQDIRDKTLELAEKAFDHKLTVNEAKTIANVLPLVQDPEAYKQLLNKYLGLFDLGVRGEFDLGGFWNWLKDSFGQERTPRGEGAESVIIVPENRSDAGTQSGTVTPPESPASKALRRK